jgi:7,8-dihydro-6-hydroxymethylpterin-pyrophosphokinase
MVKRNFVLYPLSEIAPEVKHPVLNETIKDLLETTIITWMHFQIRDVMNTP